MLPKILLVIGARPQFIKVAMLTKALESRFQVITIHTGQHYDDNMSQEFLDDFDLHIDENLNIQGVSNSRMVGLMLMELERVINEHSPAAVVVFGDTSSTVAGGLAARYTKTPLVHYEAGHRSFDMDMPEEVNRICTDHVSDLLLCASPSAEKRLRLEQVPGEVVWVGDIMLDTLKEYLGDTEQHLARYGLNTKEYTLVTIHRQANTDEPENLKKIMKALQKATDETFIFPIHPRTKNALERDGLWTEMQGYDHIQIVEPVSYPVFIALLSQARRVLTDSGGIQKEAYYLRIPCITCRPSTEWTETLDGEWNLLVGAQTQAILDALASQDPDIATHTKPYGDGDSVPRAAQAIVDRYGNQRD